MNQKYSDEFLNSTIAAATKDPIEEINKILKKIPNLDAELREALANAGKNKSESIDRNKTFEKWKLVDTPIGTLINRCARITQSKGFDTSQHLTQVCLVVTELAEALEHIKSGSELGGRDYSDYMDLFKKSITKACQSLENTRKHGVGKHKDDSIIVDEGELLEELADTVIRIFSYIGGNDKSREFCEALDAKLIYNSTRELCHGKNF